MIVPAAQYRATTGFEQYSLWSVSSTAGENEISLRGSNLDLASSQQASKGPEAI